MPASQGLQDVKAGVNILSGIAGLTSGMSALDRAQLNEIKQDSAWKAKVRDFASNYDPAEETREAGRYAGQLSQHNLEQSLGNMDRQARNAGGMSMTSTKFAVDAQKTADNVIGPLQQYIAQLKATESSRKMGMLHGAMFGQGNTAAAYARMSANAPGYGAAISLLGSGIDHFAGGKETAKDSVGSDAGTDSGGKKETEYTGYTGPAQT